MKQGRHISFPASDYSFLSIIIIIFIISSHFQIFPPIFTKILLSIRLQKAALPITLSPTKLSFMTSSTFSLEDVHLKSAAECRGNKVKNCDEYIQKDHETRS